MVNELSGLTILFAPAAYNVSVPVDGSAFLEQFDMVEDRMNLDFGTLVAMTAIYLFAAYCFLRFFVKEHR